jgi:hypothetical protein
MEVTAMNPMERLLQDELYGLTDRIASRVRERTVVSVSALQPELYQRTEEASQRLSELREELLGRYAEWRDLLETSEALWALAEEVAGDTTADEWAVALDRRAA